MNCAFYTLGCKTNQYETQAMEQLLSRQGHEIRSFEQDCDAYIINTCSVTAVADKKNRAVIRRCRRDHPDAIIGVCGCYSQHDSEAVRSLGIDVVGGSARRQEFLDMVLAALQEQGYREIVITGIEIASWGADLPGKPEPTVMIEAVAHAVPALRIRLGSLEPRIVTEDFCLRLKRLPNLCPQFHLSMQSGSDTVLQRMRRKYDTARYFESVALLKEHFPGCAITTDMIVAFPGETEEEFRESLAFIQTCGFADMHIFPYSRRPGTPADKMPGQHNNATKEERSRSAIAVASGMNLAYRESLVGSVQEVLFEEMDGDFFTGHAPNYVKVYAKGEDLHNQVRSVRITAGYKDGLRGEIVR